MSDIIYTPPASSGGGTTINQTNQFIPYRRNGTTFFDSNLYNDQDSIFLTTATAGDTANAVGIKVDFTNRMYFLGDYNAISNGTYLNVSESNQQIYTSNQGINIGLKLNFANNQYKFGDFEGYSNFTFINVNDQNQEIRLTSQGFVFIGDTDNNHNGTYLTIDDNIQYVSTVNQGATKGLYLDFDNKVYQFGDFNNVNSGTSFIIDDASTKMTFNTQFLNFVGASLSSNTAGGNSGRHLVLTLNGTQYKIALLNP